MFFFITKFEIDRLRLDRHSNRSIRIMLLEGRPAPAGYFTS